MISVACPWKPPDGTDPGSVADELKNRFEHAPLVDRISTRRFGHGDGICLLEIVLGIAPSCQCGAHETHKHVALPFVLQRRCGDVESIFKETEAVVRESDVEQVAWRQSRPQDRPILIVHHHRGAGCTLLDEVLRIRLLLGDGDAVNRDADRLEPVADIELIAHVPHSDNFARDLVDALDASVTAACDCYAWPLEDLRDIDHLVPAHTRVDRRGEPSERHVRLPFRQNFDWANAWPAVDQVDRNPLPPEEAFMKRDIDTGELRLRVPHKLKAHAVLRLSDGRNGRYQQQREENRSDSPERSVTLHEGCRGGHGMQGSPQSGKPALQ